MDTWMCYVEGEWVNQPIPALYHDDEHGCPTLHNELCGYYEAREELSYTLEEFRIDLYEAERVCHNNVAYGDGRMGVALSVVKTVIGLLDKGVIQLTDDQLSASKMSIAAFKRMRDIHMGRG